MVAPTDEQRWLESLTCRLCRQAGYMLILFSACSGLLQSTVAVRERHAAVVRSIVEKEARKRELERRHDELAAEKAFLNTPAGITAEARHYGFGVEGERRGMIVTPPPTPTSAEPGPVGSR